MNHQAITHDEQRNAPMLQVWTQKGLLQNIIQFCCASTLVWTVSPVSKQWKETAEEIAEQRLIELSQSHQADENFPLRISEQLKRRYRKLEVRKAPRYWPHRLQLMVAYRVSVFGVCLPHRGRTAVLPQSGNLLFATDEDLLVLDASNGSTLHTYSWPSIGGHRTIFSSPGTTDNQLFLSQNGHLVLLNERNYEFLKDMYVWDVSEEGNSLSFSVPRNLASDQHYQTAVISTSRNTAFLLYQRKSTEHCDSLQIVAVNLADGNEIARSKVWTAESRVIGEISNRLVEVDDNHVVLVRLDEIDYPSRSIPGA